MAMFKGFKLPDHQKFEYRPRYWSPEKEDLERRLGENQKMRDRDPEALKSRISMGLKRGSRGGGGSYSGKFMSSSNKLLIGIIVVLFILSYFILSVYLPDFVEMIEK